jgi:hypothetical protein
MGTLSMARSGFVKLESNYMELRSGSGTVYVIVAAA